MGAVLSDGSKVTPSGVAWVVKSRTPLGCKSPWAGRIVSTKAANPARLPRSFAPIFKLSTGLDEQFGERPRGAHRADAPAIDRQAEALLDRQADPGTGLAVAGDVQAGADLATAVAARQE